MNPIEFELNLNCNACNEQYANNIRNTWGNEGTMVTKEMVQKVRDEEKRATQWTEAELQPFADKNVEGEIPAGPGATAAAAAK